jgi:hypothetical protein
VVRNEPATRRRGNREFALQARWGARRSTVLPGASGEVLGPIRPRAARLRASAPLWRLAPRGSTWCHTMRWSLRKQAPEAAIPLGLATIITLTCLVPLGGQPGASGQSGPSPASGSGRSLGEFASAAVAPTTSPGQNDSGPASCPFQWPPGPPCGVARGGPRSAEGVPPGGWIDLSPTDAPMVNDTNQAEATYDPAADEIVLLQDICGPAGNAWCDPPVTWVYRDSSWISLGGAGLPSVRFDEEGLGYDPGLRAVVMLGGFSGRISNETFAFANGTWTNITTSTAPSLLDEGLVYDAGDGYLLATGGINRTGQNTNATWVYNNGNWSEINATGAAVPAFGEFNEANPVVYDPALGVVLFDWTNWTYIYRGGSWTAVYAPIPATFRVGGSLVFDSQAGLVLYVGGVFGTQHYDDTWAFNGTSWSELDLSQGPADSEFACLVDDPAASGVIQFGGTWTNSTWLFGSGNVSFQATPAGGGSIQFGGSLHANDTSAVFPYGNYTPREVPSPGYWGTGLLLSGSLGGSGPTEELIGDASVSATFSAFPRVELTSEAPQCPVDFNGTTYANGSNPYFAPGTFALSAPACTDVTFDGWGSGGNASVADPSVTSTTVTLSGPGSVIALYVVNVTFYVSPTGAGGLLVGSASVPLGESEARAAGTYAVEAVPAPGWRPVGFTASPGITVGNGTTAIDEDGWLEANFAPYPVVSFMTTPNSCPGVSFNGTIETPGGLSNFVSGTYPVVAPTCSDELFEHWLVSGGVTVASAREPATTATVSSNGTLEAVYGAAAWVTVGAAPSAAAGTVNWNGSAMANGSTFETLDGSYPIEPNAAPGWEFAGWSVSGGATVVGDHVTLTANGSVRADFEANATTPGGGKGAGSGGTWLGLEEWEWGLVGAGLVTVAMIGVVARRRRAVRSPPPAEPITRGSEPASDTEKG